MFSKIRFLSFALLLAGAAIMVPSTLMRTTLGDNDKGSKTIKPPDKPAIETVVEVGDASPVRCKGHILHGPNKDKH